MKREQNRQHVAPNERALLERINYQWADITAGCIYEASRCFCRGMDAGEDTQEFEAEIAKMKDYLAFGFAFGFGIERECADFKLNRFLELIAKAAAGNLREYRKGKYDDLLKATVRQAWKTLPGFEGQWSEGVRTIFEKLFDEDPKFQAEKHYPADKSLKRAAKRKGLLSPKSGRPRKSTRTR